MPTRKRREPTPEERAARDLWIQRFFEQQSKQRNDIKKLIRLGDRLDACAGKLLEKLRIVENAQKSFGNEWASWAQRRMQVDGVRAFVQSHVDFARQREIRKAQNAHIAHFQKERSAAVNRFYQEHEKKGAR